MAPVLIDNAKATIVWGNVVDTFDVGHVRITESNPDAPCRKLQPAIERCPTGGNGKHSRGWRPKKARNRR